MMTELSDKTRIKEWWIKKVLDLSGRHALPSEVLEGLYMKNLSVNDAVKHIRNYINPQVK